MTVTLSDALVLYRAAECPPLCPCCGRWDGPALPFCTDAGWTHQRTCSQYTFGLDLCGPCDARLVADAHDVIDPIAAECLPDERTAR